MATELKNGRYFLKLLKRLARKYPSLLNDVAQLGEQLLATPRLGTPLGNNCYKIRLAVRSKQEGKSSGMRVITYVVVRLQVTAEQTDVVYLAAIYDKSEQEILEGLELKAILNELKADESSQV